MRRQVGGTEMEGFQPARWPGQRRGTLFTADGLLCLDNGEGERERERLKERERVSGGWLPSPCHPRRGHVRSVSAMFAAFTPNSRVCLQISGQRMDGSDH